MSETYDRLRPSTSFCYLGGGGRRPYFECPCSRTRPNVFALDSGREQLCETTSREVRGVGCLKYGSSNKLSIGACSNRLVPGKRGGEPLTLLPFLLRHHELEHTAEALDLSSSSADSRSPPHALLQLQGLPYGSISQDECGGLPPARGPPFTVFLIFSSLHFLLLSTFSF